MRNLCFALCMAIFQLSVFGRGGICFRHDSYPMIEVDHQDILSVMNIHTENKFKVVCMAQNYKKMRRGSLFPIKLEHKSVAEVLFVKTADKTSPSEFKWENLITIMYDMEKALVGNKGFRKVSPSLGGRHHYFLGDGEDVFEALKIVDDSDFFTSSELITYYVVENWDGTSSIGF